MTTKTQIAEMLIEYQRVQKQADYLKAEITKGILELGDDVTAGDAVAKFNKGKSFKDYKLAVEELPHAMKHLIEKYLRVENIDSKFYKVVCEELEIAAPVGKTTEPTVSIKI